MKFQILFFLFFHSFCVVMTAQYEKKGLILSIKKDNNKVLSFIVENNTSNTIYTDQFRMSELNYVYITSPDGSKITYGGISCHSLGKATIPANGKREWKMDMSILDDPFISKKEPLPKGQYKIVWVINNLSSNPFSYEKN